MNSSCSLSSFRLDSWHGEPGRQTRWLALAAALISMALAGCGSSPTVSAQGPGLSAKSTAGKPAAGLSAAASTNALASTVQSVFQADLPSGRDPFFPGASRSSAKAAQSEPVSQLPASAYLKLVGLRSGTARPMALINRTTFAPGEESDVSIVVSNQFSKPEVQKVSIRCLEIRPDSVLISIAGEQGQKELRMAQGK
jgi:hypothetical protein